MGAIRVYNEAHQPQHDVFVDGGSFKRLSMNFYENTNKIAVNTMLVDKVIDYMFTAGMHTKCDINCDCHRDLNCTGDCNTPGVCVHLLNCNCTCTCNCPPANCACECGKNSECVCDCVVDQVSGVCECNCTYVANCDHGVATPRAQNCAACACTWSGQWAGNWAGLHGPWFGVHNQTPHGPWSGVYNRTPHNLTPWSGDWVGLHGPWSGDHGPDCPSHGPHSAHGSCFSGDTLIVLSDGSLIKIKDVEPGMLIKCVGGTDRVVKVVVDEKPIHKITFQGGCSVISSASQPYILKNKTLASIEPSANLHLTPAKLKAGDILLSGQEVITIEDLNTVDTVYLLECNKPDSMYYIFGNMPVVSSLNPENPVDLNSIDMLFIAPMPLHK